MGAHHPIAWMDAPGSAAAMRTPDPAARFQSPSPRGNPMTIWLPLAQAWRQLPQREFQAGWTRIERCGSGLRYDIIFVARSPQNRARRPSDPTWELGDVCEIFVQLEGHTEYVELHVTPENHRLQLRWTEASHEAFSAGAIPLEHALVSDPEWAITHSMVEAGHWRVSAFLPKRSLGLAAHVDGRLAFRTAVCRYDCESTGGPVLSSTAALRELSFHRLNEWTRLEFPSGQEPVRRS